MEPPFKSDRQSLILYIKSLSKKFKKFEKRGKKHKIIKVPEPPPVSLERIKRGKKSFMINCSGCHGVKGEAMGLAQHELWTTHPSHLAKEPQEPWNFPRGATRKDLFLTLRTGLSPTAMPKFSPRIFKDQEIWDIVDFVLTLGNPEQPQVKPMILAKKTNTNLPDDFNASFWKETEPAYIPLGGRVLKKPKDPISQP
ncbi:MAG: hypothetical protein Ct9H300mP23_02450 [Nitrospinota bacterium]|nr:MAG: hypothetical protein Ct9H300mP23_02450 [Nitrospinota bacterium]